MIKRKNVSFSLTLFLILFCAENIFCASPEKGFIDTHVHIREMTEGGPKGIMLNAKDQQSKSKKFMGSKGNNRKQFRNNTNASASSNLISKMNEVGVSQALVVVVPADGNSHESEYSDMKKLVQQNPERLKLLAGGAQLSDLLYTSDPNNVTASEKKQFRNTAQSILNDGAVGFGEMISYHLCMAKHHSFKYTPSDHPLFLLLADIAAENDVAIDLHMEAIEQDRPMPQNLRNACSQNPTTLKATIPALERLLAHNRKARIVWQHIGWDNTGEMKPGLLQHLLKKHPNLYMGLRVEKRETQVGNGGPMPNRIVDRTGKINTDWYQLIQNFPDRLVIGSDEFFYARTDERPNQSFVETFSILKQLDSSLSRKIGRDNVIRIYGIH